jgi:hypothetical protein
LHEKWLHLTWNGKPILERLFVHWLIPYQQCESLIELHPRKVIMIRFFAIAVAIAAFSVLTDSSAQAQNFAGGYQFGAGINSNCGAGRGIGLGFGCSTPREQLPYFAQYPPVYYSHIVKRPYGISPYAAPAGIAPVEMSYPAAPPVSIKNPYFKQGMSPAKSEITIEDATINKSTAIINPNVETLAIK